MSRSSVPNGEPLEAAAAQLLEKWRRRTGAPALAGVVVGPDGIVWMGARGRRRISSSEVVAQGDLWRLEANTQAMTAAVHARLVQGGLARWDMTPSELFPDMAVDPGWAKVTVADFMGHRTGLRDRGLIDIDWLAARRDDRASPVDQRAAFARHVLAAPPSRRPGAFAYAEANYIIAGAAIERLSGQSFEAASQTWLFGSLGMTSAGFGTPQGDQPWGHTAGFLGFGVGHPVNPSRADGCPAILDPACGARMSLGDYAKFLRLFLDEGGGFLTRANLSALTMPPSDEDRDHALGWRTFRHRNWSQGPAWAHCGDGGLWHSVAVVGPRRGLAVATVSNAVGAGVSAANGLALDLVRRYAARSSH